MWVLKYWSTCIFLLCLVHFGVPKPLKHQLSAILGLFADILYDSWSPAMTVSSVCISILSMLSSSPAKQRPADNDRYVKNCRNGRSPKETRWWFHDDKVWWVLGAFSRQQLLFAAYSSSYGRWFRQYCKPSIWPQINTPLLFCTWICTSVNSPTHEPLYILVYRIITCADRKSVV